MGGLSPISPVDMVWMAQQLQWPADPDEVVRVLTAMDDAFRELNQPAK